LAQQHALVLSAAALLQQNYGANNMPQHGTNGSSLQHHDLRGKLQQLLQLMEGCNAGDEWRCSVQHTAMLALQQQRQAVLGRCSGYVSSRMRLKTFVYYGCVSCTRLFAAISIQTLICQQIKPVLQGAGRCMCRS
jgi:hypothetical protein